MDYDVQCDEFDRFEPTAEDWVEDTDLDGEDFDFLMDEDEVDFDEALSIFRPDFLGIVDTLNGYRV